MALQTSGAISLANVQSEFGGSNPISISEYVRGGSYVPNVTQNNAIPTTTSNMGMDDFYGTLALIPIVSGTTYVSNGSATGSLTSAVGSWTLHKTVFDYQQSGNIWTFQASSLLTGTMRVRTNINPTNTSNSGDDRILRLYRNGSQIGAWSTAAHNTLVVDTNVSISPSDTLVAYMDNSIDWRDLGSYEVIENVYLTGA